MIEFPIPPRVVREPNPGVVSLIQGAKEYLWDGHGSHCEDKHPQICSALYWVSCDRNHNDPGSWLVLRDAINEGLSPCTSYVWWLCDALRIADMEYPALARATDKVQAARLRWMNQLIEEFGGST